MSFRAKRGNLRNNDMVGTAMYRGFQNQMGTAAVAVPILRLKSSAVFIEGGNVARLQKFALTCIVSAILDEVNGFV